MTASSALGKRLQAWGLFIIPEESEVPSELKGLAEEEEAPSKAPLWPQALLSPYIQAIHLSMVRQRSSGSGEKPAASLVALRERLITEGPTGLSPKEKMRILWDVETVFWLHRELWSRAPSQLHQSWTLFQSESAKSPLLRNYLVGK